MVIVVVEDEEVAMVGVEQEGAVEEEEEAVMEAPERDVFFVLLGINMGPSM